MSAQPSDTPVRCIRRWCSVSTSCRCPDCRPTKVLADKRKRVYGRSAPDVSAAAWAALDRMLAQGRIIREIAATAGIPPDGLRKTIERDRAGRRERFGYLRGIRLIEAEGKTPTAGQVDATGTRRRLQALAVAGRSAAWIASEAGLTEAVVRKVQTGRCRTTDARVVNSVRDVYPRLLREGPAGRAVAARAVNRGWAPDAAWDDIDDPGERPKGAVPAQGRAAKRVLRENPADD